MQKQVRLINKTLLIFRNLSWEVQYTYTIFYMCHRHLIYIYIYDVFILFSHIRRQQNNISYLSILVAAYFILYMDISNMKIKSKQDICTCRCAYFDYDVTLCCGLLSQQTARMKFSCQSTCMYNKLSKNEEDSVIFFIWSTKGHIESINWLNIV